MCAVDEAEAPVILLDEGSSSLSSIAEDEEVSDAERPRIRIENQVKMMCSYGGRILPRPVDGQLRYVGGETRILVVKKGVLYSDLMVKLSRLASRNVVLKYQLPNEDLDALISVTSDEDVRNMVDEYEKIEGRSGDGAAKLRAFLFPANVLGASPVNSVKSSGVNPFAADSSDDESSKSPPVMKTARKNQQMPQTGERNVVNIPHHPLHEEYGSLRAYHQHQHQHQPQPQHDHEFEYELKARANFLHHSDHSVHLHHQLHHPQQQQQQQQQKFHVESCGCVVQCKSCFEQEQSPMLLPPRHSAPPHRVSSYHLPGHYHHPQQYPAQYQQHNHVMRPGFGYEQKVEMMSRPEFKPEFGVSNKFSFDHFYYKHPAQQTAQPVYEVLHR